MRGAAVILSVLLVAATLGVADDFQIVGDYVEVRTADVYTGPCFANGEVGLTGSDAILAWRIREGGWNGVSLEGLSVLAVVRAKATLGDPYSNPQPSRSVLLVDERATPEQRAALIAFAREQNRELLNNILAVETTPIRFDFDHVKDHAVATVEVEKLAKISTRALHESDQICRNESVFYPPLVGNLSHSMPVMATDAGYQGNHLGRKWRERERRGSFVGTFAF